MAKTGTINEVYVSSDFAPLGKKRPGYFVSLEDRTLYSIKWGFLHALSPHRGRYCISNNGVREWVPRDAIKKARRTSTTPHFYRVSARS